MTEHQDLTGYAKKTDIPDISGKANTADIPTKLSQLTDDLGSRPKHTHSQYLTKHQDLSDYAKTDDVNTSLAKKQNVIEDLDMIRANAEAGVKISGIPTDVCKRLNIEYTATGTVELKWKDPSDTYNSNGQLLTSWAGTKIVMKNGSYPEDETDGTVVIYNQVRNAYSDSAYVYHFSSAKVAQRWKFRAFPYTANGVINYDNRNKFDNTVIYEMLLDTTNSNKESAISRPKGCLNEFYRNARMNFDEDKMDYGDWGDVFFMNIQTPVMMYNDNAKDESGNSLNGQIYEYLNPDDYYYQTNGEASHVADADCNANAVVQWYIKNLWIKIEQYLPKKYHIYVSNKKVDNDYKNILRYNKKGEIVDYYYQAMFDAVIINGVARSLADQNVNHNTAGTTQIANARANGEGWDVWEARFLFVHNILLMMISGTRDTQAAFGTGRYTGGSSKSNNLIKTGLLTNRGPFHGDNANGAVKVFHSENPWGNVCKIVQGILQKDGKIYVKITPFTNDGTTVEDYQQTDVTGYIDTGITLSGTSGGYISEVVLIAGCGFMPSVASGSSTTHFPDGLWWNTKNIGFARCSGSSDHGLLVGAFALHLTDAVSSSGWIYGVSLSYSPS